MKGLGILCSGQGNQHPEMFDLLDGDEAAGKVLHLSANLLGSPPDALARKADPRELFRNALAQPLISSLQLATWAALRNRLPTPRVFGGYSLGELPAYGCAGALSTEETLSLATRRAALMDAASPPASGLSALRGLGRAQIEGLCRETGAEMAIVNGPDHFIVGGSEEILTLLESLALETGAQTVRRLQVGVPSHTSVLAEAGRGFHSLLEASALTNPPVPILAGISGAVVRRREEGIAALTQQISQTLNWAACMAAAWEMGCRVFLELGPGTALTKMVQDVYPEAKARSVDEFRSLKGVTSWVLKHCG
ncbi:malonyl CoA-acyl carrier protein transacylase [Desulfuromonas soudanensis]|uniref:Malonyl CoA-acyl carrier protein transacylase n=1 Tax=Desulfuromonas soudanensis TaxID=1603606 RepID=A0A0M3QEZ5_9BACT|nr:malonate decarboxylase subunit epsilon [Desulfuromonas soudanensis]ALC15173.1 malonyl CoA-acyl carrier protein transacylase [Desulfuromonas soudanensis]